MNAYFLAKAKKINNEEWVIGQYIRDIDRSNKFVHKIQSPPYAQIYAESIKPETLCGYTGRKTWEGTMVFENDIINYFQCASYLTKGIVEYKDYSFCIRWISPIAQNYITDLAWWLDNRDIRVIVNIFDN